MNSGSGIPGSGTPGRATHRLLVLRHAKSSWEHDGLDDHDRPLAPRGRRAAAALAEHLASIPASPRLALCSSARRTVETLRRLRPGLPPDLVESIEPGLYGASAGALLARLRRVPEETGAVLLVGHNPGVEELARSLSGGGDPALLDRLAGKYPTGALATVAFDGPWRSLGRGGAVLEGFVVPADLVGGDHRPA